jgi:hypothetical protein
MSEAGREPSREEDDDDAGGAAAGVEQAAAAGAGAVAGAAAGAAAAAAGAAPLPPTGGLVPPAVGRARGGGSDEGVPGSPLDFSFSTGGKAPSSRDAAAVGDSSNTDLAGSSTERSDSSSATGSMASVVVADQPGAEAAAAAAAVAPLSPLSGAAAAARAAVSFPRGAGGLPVVPPLGLGGLRRGGGGGRGGPPASPLPTDASSERSDGSSRAGATMEESGDRSVNAGAAEAVAGDGPRAAPIPIDASSEQSNSTAGSGVSASIDLGYDARVGRDDGL